MSNNSFTNWLYRKWILNQAYRSVFNFESASFGDHAFSTCGFCENVLAVVAGDDGLSMAEDDISLTASTALNVHKIGVRGGNKSFKLMGLALLFD